MTGEDGEDGAKAFYIEIEARRGKEAEVEQMLRNILVCVQEEPATGPWFAVRHSETKCAIFEMLPTIVGRQAHVDGGGNFGIVTSLEAELAPLTHVVGGEIYYPLDRAGDIMRFYRTCSSGLGEDTTTIFRLVAVPPDNDAPPPIRGKTCCMIGLCHANHDTADAVIGPLEQLGKPLVNGVKRCTVADMGELDPASHSAGSPTYAGRVSKGTVGPGHRWARRAGAHDDPAVDAIRGPTTRRCPHPHLDGERSVPCLASAVLAARCVARG